MKQDILPEQGKKNKKKILDDPVYAGIFF